MFPNMLPFGVAGQVIPFFNVFYLIKTFTPFFNFYYAWTTLCCFVTVRLFESVQSPCHPATSNDSTGMVL